MLPDSVPGFVATPPRARDVAATAGHGAGPADVKATTTGADLITARPPYTAGVMRAHGAKILMVLLATCVVVLVLVVSDQREAEQPRPPAPLPAAVVTMGDSTLAGEGGGDYEPGTRGEGGNWCHRSPAAPIHHLPFPPSVKRINLACSGAKAPLVGLGPDAEHAEGSQAAQLAAIAQRYRITDIVVQVGANDEPNFAETMHRCIGAWAERAPSGCSDQLRAEWGERVQAMTPTVVDALRDVRMVMSQARYQPDEYTLTVQSYASPVSPDIPPEVRNLSGCPFQTEDLRWVRETAVPQLSDGLRSAAEQVGARFLDLSEAGVGHEACTAGKVAPGQPTDEWFTRLSVDWESLKYEDRAPHAMQESFHANAAGHAQFGRCLGEFLAGQERLAVCLPDANGDLRPVPEDVAELRPANP